MSYQDSFTDYDQLNHLTLVRIADALELKNKSKSKLYEQIIYFQKLCGDYEHRMQQMNSQCATLKGKLAELKKLINQH